MPQKMTDLIALKQWNAQRRQEDAINQQAHNGKDVPNGIACPDCGGELRDVDRGTQLITSPPQYHARCPNAACEWTGTRVV